MAEPLGIAEAASLLAPLRSAAKLLIAVSGGPDSIALMRLAATVRLSADLPPLCVATVDHCLSAGSDAVARDVVAQAKDLGLDAHLLRWEGAKPSSGVQEAARAARYALLGALAHDIDASHLATAHTLDDQAETILFRMTRGSGPAGLAGMSPESRRASLVHCRPLLSVPKARLVETCRQAGWSYVEDPANADLRFARARLRGLMPRLAEEGLDAAALATLGGRLRRDELALREMAAACRAESCIEASADRQIYEARPLLGASSAIGVRVLEAILTDFAKAGAPRLARLEALAAALTDAFAAGRPLRRTLHGARITLTQDGRLELAPEGPRRRGAGPLADPKPGVDSRNDSCGCFPWQGKPDSLH